MNKFKHLLLAFFLSGAITAQAQTNNSIGTGNQFISYSGAKNNPNYMYASETLFSNGVNGSEHSIRNNIPELLRKPLKNEIKIERYKTIVLRDGVKIYADVYLPAAPGKYPTIVIRTCYGVQRDGGHQDKIRFAQEGYAVVFADIRSE
jgi:predicted acyl esterase